jgi:NADH-quinone oxidoreductase subunit L
MNGIAASTATISTLIKGVQSGKIQNYLLYFFSGLAVFLIIFIYFWKP